MRDKPQGATWVTREHVFVDRVACPWLIRRFIDPGARFRFVAWDADVGALERAGELPFDFDTGRFTHRTEAGKERCTFEVLMDEFALHGDPALEQVARIVHAADVDGELDTSPEARGFKALSLGWRYLYTDDHEAAREGAKLYDALYLWAQARRVQEQDRDTLAGMSSLGRYHHLRRALGR